MTELQSSTFHLSKMRNHCRKQKAGFTTPEPVNVIDDAIVIAGGSLGARNTWVIKPTTTAAGSFYVLRKDDWEEKLKFGGLDSRAT